MSRRVRFTEDELRATIEKSLTWAEALRSLGYRSAGGNWKTLQKYARKWDISTAHFDPDVVRRETSRRAARPLASVMVANSAYSRSQLKQRLFRDRLKERRCEQCGQDELWQGRRMALILDHVSGVPDDHRLENLRVLCPNCAATLETHCGRKNRLAPMPRDCLTCREPFFPQRIEQRYCSRACGVRWDRAGIPILTTRRVKRPPCSQLLDEIERDGYLATGRKYGVSDNAIRKWVAFYEREIERRRRDAAA